MKTVCSPGKQPGKVNEAKSLHDILGTAKSSLPIKATRQLDKVVQSMAAYGNRIDQGSTEHFRKDAEDLLKVAKERPRVVELLVEILANMPGHAPGTKYVCEAAAMAVGYLNHDLGPHLEVAITALCKHLKCVPNKAYEAMRFMAWSYPVESQQAIYAELVERPWIWQEAVGLLCDMNPVSVTCNKWLRDERSGPQAAALAYAVRTMCIRPRTKPRLLKMVKAAMTSPDPTLRDAGVEAAFNFDVRDDLKDLLLKSLDDRSGVGSFLGFSFNIRWNPLWCRALLPELTDALLHNRHAILRASVAQGFGNLGKKAVQALPALMTVAKDVDKKVRAAAKAAISKIVEHSID